MSCKPSVFRTPHVLANGTLTLHIRAAYSGAALAFRDRLVIEWNKTQQRQTFADQKRVYCMSRLQEY